MTEVNNGEEAVLKLFLERGSPLTRAEIDAVLRDTFASEDVEFIVESLLVKELIVSRRITNILTIFYPTQKTAAYFVSCNCTTPETDVRESLQQETELLRTLVDKVRRLPHMSELEQRKKELKLANQRLLIDLWRENLECLSTTDCCSARHDKSLPKEKSADQKIQLGGDIRFEREKDTIHETLKKRKALEMEKIRLLEAYNELKDVTHGLLGIIAEECQCTVKDLYKQFDIPAPK